MNPSVTARLIAVGDELLAGLHPDLNGPHIARRLERLGIRVLGVEVVPDDETRIEAAVRAAVDAAPLVIVTGGLGPTLDDITRFGIAAAFGLEVEERAEAAQGLARWFDGRGIEMPTLNLRQALLPVGAALVLNRAGTAPGFRVERDSPDGEGRGTVLFSLPGPPREMQVVLEEEVEPWLIETGLASAPLPTRTFHLFGIGEGAFAERAGAWMDRDARLLMGCSVKRGTLSAVIRDQSAPDSGDRADGAMEDLVEQFQARFCEHIFSEDDARVEFVLGRELLASNTTVSIAESCTGGLASALLTDVPGISAVFSRAFTTYSDAAKHDMCGVDEALLATHGAVSPEVAAAMAEGAARAAGARLGLSITGIAGPGGGSEEKPVGLVWFGSCLDGVARAESRHLPAGERTWIRSLSARQALFIGLKRLRESVEVSR